MLHQVKNAPDPPAVFIRGVGENRLRGCYPPRERRFEYGQAGFRPVFKQLVFGAQTGREISPSNKSKGTECISEVRAFQNGRHSSSSRSASASRLAGENRFERCVLRDPNLEGSQEIPSFFLEEFSPGICMPPLWPGGGPKTVYKSVETGGCSSPPSRNTSDNISGRSFVYESVQRGTRSRHGHSTVSVRESRFRDQSRKVLLRSNTDLGVSRFCSEHSGYDSAPSRLQSGIYKIPLQLSPSASRSVCKRSLPVDWEVDRFNSGNISCPPALPLSPALKTPRFSPTKRLRCNNTSVERGPGGVSRHFHDSSNWKLCPEVFRALMRIRGPCAKDLFADRLNAQLPQFFSWRPDPMALASDALQQDWSNGRNYAFPPFA